MAYGYKYACMLRRSIFTLQSSVRDTFVSSLVLISLQASGGKSLYDESTTIANTEFRPTYLVPFFVHAMARTFKLLILSVLLSCIHQGLGTP